MSVDEERVASILAVSKTSGVSDASIKRTPKMVAGAVKAIEKHFVRGKKANTTVK